MSLDLEALEGEVLMVLHTGADALKGVLWEPGDAEALGLAAKDLVRLGQEAEEAIGDAARLAQVKRKGHILLDHVELLALRRARQLEREMQDQIEGLFRDHILPALIALLPALL